MSSTLNDCRLPLTPGSCGCSWGGAHVWLTLQVRSAFTSHPFALLDRVRLSQSHSQILATAYLRCLKSVLGKYVTSELRSLQ